MSLAARTPRAAAARASGCAARTSSCCAASAQLRHIAHGAGDYRQMAMGREQLWELLEGPAVTSSARMAAVEVLATTREQGDYERLRVAAEPCAEPGLRLRIEEILEEESEEDEAPIAPRAASLPR